jgi:hypothetical protein
VQERPGTQIGPQRSIEQRSGWRDVADTALMFVQRFTQGSGG